MKKRVLMILLLAVVLMVAGCSGGADDDAKVIKVGHKNYTEARILGQIFGQLIEANTDYTTEVTEFGGTSIVFEALKAREVDVYPEYTGTAYGAILDQNELKDPQAVYDYVVKEYKEQFDVEWLSELGYNNTYTFSVRKEVADKYNIKTVSEMIEVADELKFAATVEFLAREDGLPGVKKHYKDFKFKEELGIDPGLRYETIKSGKTDIIDAFSTDGKIREYDLVIMEDDKQFFPPYYVAPIMNGESYLAYPDVVAELEKLGQIMDEAAMQQLNYEVDVEKTPIEDVAHNFLVNAGLITE